MVVTTNAQTHDVAKAIGILKTIDANSDGGLSREEMMNWLEAEKKAHMEVGRNSLNDKLMAAFEVLGLDLNNFAFKTKSRVFAGGCR
jgi:hypothetical protein